MKAAAFYRPGGNSPVNFRQQGPVQVERQLRSPQSAVIRRRERELLINLCANNYLGLANHPAVIRWRTRRLTGCHGIGSVRFICGTQGASGTRGAPVRFLGTGGHGAVFLLFRPMADFFETLLGEADAVISDALNHASIIDGIRLCKAQKFRYANRDLGELEARLRETASARTRMIVTDGVFSMDGTFAPLAGICELAERHDALVVVDDSHATGFIGKQGRGTPERAGVAERVDLLTGTLGKALGGAAGGYVSGRRPMIEWLRQRSRPYLFSNSVPPVIAAATLRVLELIADGSALRAQLERNSQQFRAGLGAAGFTLTPGEHPIIPVMLGDAALAARMAGRLLELGVYVIGFSFPVVPRGQARIRTQMSAAHTPAQLERSIQAFVTAGREFGLIS